MSEDATQDYKWDVFLSYRRRNVVDEWVRDSFKELLGDWLTEELGGHQARIFFDQDVIKPGDDWAQVIVEGIRFSKCLVAVWTPSYFQSDWCMAEWKSFRERSEVAKLGPNGLAAPLLWCDGSHLPADAKSVQYADFRQFAYVGLRKTEHFVSFQQKVQELAQDIALAVVVPRSFRATGPSFPCRAPTTFP